VVVVLHLSTCVLVVLNLFLLVKVLLVLSRGIRLSFSLLSIALELEQARDEALTLGCLLLASPGSFGWVMPLGLLQGHDVLLDWGLVLKAHVHGLLLLGRLLFFLGFLLKLKLVWHCGFLLRVVKKLVKFATVLVLGLGRLLPSWFLLLLLLG